MKKSTVLRNLLSEGKIIVKPGCYDALSAKICELAGFAVIGVSGAAVSASLLGKPDVGLVTMKETVMISKYIADAVNIPVIADADTGYGNALNVLRTTEEFIKAGVAGIHIEDQVDPKRCGELQGKEIISLEEAVGKYRAADKVRKDLDPDFLLIARTDAIGAVGGSLNEAIRRGKAYADAGADMIFPTGNLSEEDLRYFIKEVKAPVHFFRPSNLSPQLHMSKLQEIGVAIVSNADGPICSVAATLQQYMNNFIKRDTDFLKVYSENTKGTIGENLMNLYGFLGLSENKKLEEMFLPAEWAAKKYKESAGHEF